MDDGSVDFREAAAAQAWSVPIEALNPAQPELFVADAMWPIFDRLRQESPVHWSPLHQRSWFPPSGDGYQPAAAIAVYE